MKTITELKLGKRIDEITQDFLVNFIKTRVKRDKETLDIEYKEFSDDIYNNNFDKLLKDVCAFANTVGGLIIFGVSEKGKYPGNIKGAKKRFSKESITRKIDSGVVYQIRGLRVEQIDLNDIANNNRVFLIEVPQSVNPPHQVKYKDGIRRYYIRIDHESKEMDHCWVEALFNKRVMPIIDVDFIINDKFPFPELEAYDKEDNEYDIKIIITNHGLISAYDTYFIVKLFKAKGLETANELLSVHSDSKIKRLDNGQHCFILHPGMEKYYYFSTILSNDDFSYIYIVVSMKDSKSFCFLFKIPFSFREKLLPYERYTLELQEIVDRHIELQEINREGYDLFFKSLIEIIKDKSPSQIYEIGKDYIIRKKY